MKCERTKVKATKAWARGAGPNGDDPDISFGVYQLLKLPEKRLGYKIPVIIRDLTEDESRTARIAELEAEVKRLRKIEEWLNAMRGPNAHRVGCECGGGNDGKHFCGDLHRLMGWPTEMKPASKKRAGGKGK